MHVTCLNVMVVEFYCTAQWLWEFDFMIRLNDSMKNMFVYLSKSKSQRRKTSSRTDRFRCGNKDDSISMAFCETNGDLDVEETEEDSNFFFVSSGDLASPDELDASFFGSVTVMPKIFPGGKASIDFPVSVDANRRAMASSTACCLLSATCEKKKCAKIYVNKI